MAQNNEIKCPVCGEGMTPDIWNSNMYFHSTSQIIRECPLKYENKDSLIKWNTLVQSRLNRAVEEAVRKERERMLDIARDIYENSLLTEWQKQKIIELKGATK